MPVSASRSRSAGAEPDPEAAVHDGDRSPARRRRRARSPRPAAPSRGSADSGMPWVMMVDSSATTARPSASASATSGADCRERDAGHGNRHPVGPLRPLEGAAVTSVKGRGNRRRMPNSCPAGFLALGSGSIRNARSGDTPLRIHGHWSGPPARPRRAPPSAQIAAHQFPGESASPLGRTRPRIPIQFKPPQR